MEGNLGNHGRGQPIVPGQDNVAGTCATFFTTGFSLVAMNGEHFPTVD